MRDGSCDNWIKAAPGLMPPAATVGLESEKKKKKEKELDYFTVLDGQVPCSAVVSPLGTHRTVMEGLYDCKITCRPVR